MTETTTEVRDRAAHDGAAGPSLRFRPDVEGLRAVAVAAVVLFHAGVPGIGGGYIGVDVFFVISGFLITSLMLREVATTGGVSLVRFYGRRCRRILPASSLVLVAVVLAGYHWLGFLRGDEIAADGRWAALFASNFNFAAQGVDYLDSQAAPSPLQHFWSLAVEEQFYFVWPALLALLIWLGLRHATPAVLGFAVAGSLAFSIWQTGTTWSYFSPATRAWELGAGCLLALAADRLDRIPPGVAAALAGTGLAGIVVAALSFDSTTPFPGYAAALPVRGHRAGPGRARGRAARGAPDAMARPDLVLALPLALAGPDDRRAGVRPAQRPGPRLPGPGQRRAGGHHVRLRREPHPAQSPPAAFASAYGGRGGSAHRRAARRGAVEDDHLARWIGRRCRISTAVRSAGPACRLNPVPVAYSS